MKIAIAGGTGFVGRALTKYLLKRGHEVIIFTRKILHSNDENLTYMQMFTNYAELLPILDGLDAIINLAGESINSGRWTSKRKQLIVNSRVKTTKEIVRIIQRTPVKPKVFINASAVGFYGTSTTATFTEADEVDGNDFLATTVRKWENEAQQATVDGVRTVYCRFGIILDKLEGALPKITLPYQLFCGGTIGSGQQWVSWIHIEDVVRGISFLIENNQINGAVNFTSPNPETMKNFGKILGRTLKRPHWLPVPEFILKILLGEMSMLVLKGQKVLPAKLETHGFSFSYPTLETAFSDIYAPVRATNNV